MLKHLYSHSQDGKSVDGKSMLETEYSVQEVFLCGKGEVIRDSVKTYKSGMQKNAFVLENKHRALNAKR